MHRIREASGSNIGGLQDPVFLSHGTENSTELTSIRRSIQQKHLVIQILFDGVNHFVTLVVLEDGTATLFDSLGTKVSDSLQVQLRSIFGSGKRISIPAIFPQVGSNCLVNAAAMATDFALKKKEPENAQWVDGDQLRQWFKLILFNENVLTPAARKRGARSRNPEKTVPSNSFLIT